MDYKDFFEKVGGDYDEVMSRLMKEERIGKYLARFPESADYAETKTALAEENWENAFRGTHTLKGVAANLGLENFRKASSELCETMRPGVKPTVDITGLVEKFDEEYKAALDAIAELLG